jgi:threonine aldolase
VRKVLGGGMRQVGFLAAAGIYALDHNVGRMQEDHDHAAILAAALQELPFVKTVMPVETNIVIFEMDERHHADDFVEKLAHHGIKCNTFGKQMIRFVTHLDVSPDMINYTVDQLKKMH